MEIGQVVREKKGFASHGVFMPKHAQNGSKVITVLIGYLEVEWLTIQDD
jgi:hypothetical protein